MKTSLNNLILKQLSEIKPEDNPEYQELDDFSLTRLFIACVIDFTAFDGVEHIFYFRQNGKWYPDKSDVKIQETVIAFISTFKDYLKNLPSDSVFKNNAAKIATYQKMRRIINLCKHEEKVL